MPATGRLSLIRLGMLIGSLMFAAIGFALGPAWDLHAPFTLFAAVALALAAGAMLGSAVLRATNPEGLAEPARQRRELFAAALLEGAALGGVMLTLGSRDPWPLLIALGPLAMLALLVFQDLTSQ
jgi:hypothetical protein